MTLAFIGLGSNLADPARQVHNALAALGAIAQTRVLRHSSLYRTAPVAFIDQPDFINAVAEIDTALSPLPLLDALQDIENRFGRTRSFRNAPRIIDLDLLWYQGVRLVSERLVLPHPRMLQRAFVMIPLCEIAPDLLLEPEGSVMEIVAGMEDASVERLSG
jgi:2-amino-4-hydroxy-6-hydroxymethyldihydropteridine diphosphokinase